MEKKGFTYGGHRLLGTDGDGFFGLTTEQKAYSQGWSAGCPVTEKLVKQNGPEDMIKRYGRVNFWFGYIDKTLTDLNREELRAELKTPIRREWTEPHGKVDSSVIPDDFKDNILVTPWGYSLPRLFVAYIGEGKGTGDRMIQAIEHFEKAVNDSQDMDDVLIRFTENLILDAGEPKKLLKTMIPQGKLNEDNCYVLYTNTVKKMKEESPFLWSIYSSMWPDERRDIGMADVSI